MDVVAASLAKAERLKKIWAEQEEEAGNSVGGLQTPPRLFNHVIFRQSGRMCCFLLPRIGQTGHTHLESILPTLDPSQIVDLQEKRAVVEARIYAKEAPLHSPARVPTTRIGFAVFLQQNPFAWHENQEYMRDWSKPGAATPCSLTFWVGQQRYPGFDPQP